MQCLAVSPISLFSTSVSLYSKTIFKKTYSFTVQLGYCDSDVTVCLLFWNMPIIQDRDVKFPYKPYRHYLQAF